MAILAAARVAAWLSYAMPRWASRSAKPMTPRPMRRIWMASWRSTGSRVAGHVDDVVEEAHGEPHGGVEALELDPPMPNEARQVDGAERALVGPQRHVPAGVRGHDATLRREGIGVVDPVEEQQPRFAAAPGVLDDGVEDRRSASREVHVEAYVLVQTEVGAAADASGEIGALEE